MKRRTRVLFAGALLAFCTAGTALAGFHQGQVVVIVDASSVANGDLGHVRNTPDATQYIGCTSTGTRSFARDLAALYRSCSTSNPAHLAAIHALNPDSHLICGWNASGQCSFINAHDGSLTVPKQ